MSSRIISQNYIPGISFAKISSPLMLLCCNHQVFTVSHFPKTFMKNLGNGKKSIQTAKCLLIYFTRKIPINRFIFSTMKSIIPSQSNINFYVITLCKLIRSRNHFCCTTFLTEGFMYTDVMLILINQYLLNVAFSMEWSKRSQAKFQFPTPFNAIWKILLLLTLVFLFFILPFLF